MFNKVDAGWRPPQKLREPCLALLQWQRAQVLAVQLQQDESVQDDLRIMVPAVQPLEIRYAIIPAHHGLAVAVADETLSADTALLMSG